MNSIVWYEAHYLYLDPKTTRESDWENANGWGKGEQVDWCNAIRERRGDTPFIYSLHGWQECSECGRKLDTRRNRSKELLTTMTCLRLECLVRLWWVFSVLLFDSTPSGHNSRGADWLLRHSKLTTLYTVSYKIKYTAVGLSCVHNKI